MATVQAPAAPFPQKTATAQRMAAGAAPRAYRPEVVGVTSPAAYRPGLPASAQRKQSREAVPVYRPNRNAETGTRGVGAGGRTPGGSIQRYTKIEVSGKEARLASSGDVMVRGTALFATEERIEEANRQLKLAGPHGSMVKLVKSGTVKRSEAAPGKEFFSVEPALNYTAYHSRMLGQPNSFHAGMRVQDEGKFQMWADCRRSAEVVTGASSVLVGFEGLVKVAGKAVEGYSGAINRPNDVKNDSKTARLSFLVYTSYIPRFLKKYNYDKLLFKGKSLVEAFPETKVFTRVEELVSWAEKQGGIAAGNISVAERLYACLRDDAKEKFHQEAGTNEYANPQVGDAYSTVTEYGMPDFKTGKGGAWPFHWGGVVMKGGKDNVALENYSVGEDESVRNRDWKFAMYGTEDPEQSFHREHMQTGLHGNVGTTIAVETLGSEANRNLVRMRAKVETLKTMETRMGVDFRVDLLNAAIAHNRFAGLHDKALLTRIEVLGSGREFTAKEEDAIDPGERRWIPV